MAEGEMKQYQNSKAGLVFGLLLFAPLATNAAIVNGYGANASASTASNCPSYCTTAGGGDFQYDSDGGEFSNTAFAEENSYALGRAQSSLTGSTYLPELKVLASSDVRRRGGATAFGVQGFTYGGATSTTITLDLNLHGSITDNLIGYTGNTLTAKVAVLLGSSLNWYADFGTLVYEVAGETTQQAGVETLGLSTPGIDQSTSSFINFNINPGDDFYVVAQMAANGQNGIADAWNTLTLSFDDDTGLTATSVSTVPIPSAVWLFGSGLLGLIGISRKKKVA
jgi:hypothetical protein